MTIDSYVATTCPRLMQTNSPVEREKLLDALAEYEWRLRLAGNQGDQRFPIRPRTANLFFRPASSSLNRFYGIQRTDHLIISFPDIILRRHPAKRRKIAGDE